MSEIPVLHSTVRGWLLDGPCSTTTHHYVEADLKMKERALARLLQPEPDTRRYKASDSLLKFLKQL